MEKFLSILRRISFLCMLVLMILDINKVEIHMYFMLSVLIYIFTLIISYIYYYFLYKKYPQQKFPFINRLWRVDICNPIIEHSQNHYRVGERLGNLWEYRNYKEDSTSEKIKRFFVRIFVYLIIATIIGAIIYAII